MAEKVKYGNWIRKKVLWILGLSSLGMGILGTLPFPPIIRIILVICSIALFISFLYPLYLYYAFSHHGGDLQDKVYDLIVEKLTKDVKGAALDIGTGNGILAIKLAQRYPEVRVVGMDYWGKNWEYSKSVCKENARHLKVAERVSFLKGDASSLDLPEGSFEAVVSNLTFHEVKSVLQKRELVTEALRVLKPGGKFAFVDYFFEKKYFGETSEFQTFLQNLELSKMDFKPLGEVLEFQKILRHPKALGKVGIIYGVK